jgi:hypothetical protein
VSAATGRRSFWKMLDVRFGSVKRCAAAVGEGSMAVEFVHERLAASGVRVV